MTALKFNRFYHLSGLTFVLLYACLLFVQNVAQTNEKAQRVVRDLTEMELNDELEPEVFEQPGDKAAAESRAEPEAEPTLGERLAELLACHKRELHMERLQVGSFWLARNLIAGNLSRSMGCAESITYTTNGDYTFFDNVETVAERWQGPISFAIFAPGYDLNATLDAIQYVRNCLPNSDLVRHYVSYHVYFPNKHMPSYLPKTEAEALEWPYNCTAPAPYLNVNRSEMYKTKHNLTYPINLGRNIARKAANTYFIFACDIELYPSPGFIQQFLEMIDRDFSVLGDDTSLRVFPVPVFEIDKDARLPNTKVELVAQLRNKTAIPFHAHVCNNCHLVPEQKAWVNASDDGDEMSVFSVGKREGKFKYWEPFYVSDNLEPIFDERVTWEGQANKRIQNYAMCLLGYEYHVLHPAFLVHSPGIKHFNKKSPRVEYARQMMKIIKKKIEPEYRVLYGQNKNCVT